MDSILNFLQQVITLRGNFNWGYVWQFLFATDILQGVIITVVLSVLAQLFGSLIGLLLYFMRRSNNRALRGLAETYVWFFRGTPLLVQILFLNALFPYLGIANPLIATHLFLHLGFIRDIPLDAFIAGLIALSMNEGAYMAEIVRAGIDAIDVGQIEAAKSLGMTYRQAMQRIVLPQALRVIVPPLGNEFNSMLKSSSLVSVISVYELLNAAQAHGFNLFAPLELYTVAAIWYIVLTTVWGFIQSAVERRLNASNIEPAVVERDVWWRRAIGIGHDRGGGVVVPTGIDHR
jgi:polar amino acid transport system permease protein